MCSTSIFNFIILSSTLFLIFKHIVSSKLFLIFKHKYSYIFKAMLIFSLIGPKGSCKDILVTGCIIATNAQSPEQAFRRCSTKYRSSHRRCSVRKGDLRNFAKFLGEHLRQSLFFNKVAGL